VPICQEDMIGGQMAFSLLVLDALYRMGIHVTNEGAEAYYYTWRVVGAILGVDLEASPADLAGARDFSDLYLARHMGPSEEGVRLTRQLIELYEQVVPGTLMDPVVPALIRYLLGETSADWLRVPRSHWDTVVPLAPVLLGVLDRVKEASPLAAMAINRLDTLITTFELSSLTRGRVMQYSIPEHLRSEYGLSSAGPATGRWTPPPLSPLLPR